MSSSEATRRASSTAESEQHPPCRALSSWSSRGHCCSVMPTTSWPCAWSSAAATEESTPPDIATAILTCVPGRPRRRASFDQVAFGGFHRDALRFEVGHSTVELVRLPSDLEQDPALVTADV